MINRMRPLLARGMLTVAQAPNARAFATLSGASSFGQTAFCMRAPFVWGDDEEEEESTADAARRMLADSSKSRDVVPR